MKELNNEETHNLQCYAIALLIFSVFGDGNVFALLLSIFVLVVLSQERSYWTAWRTAIMIMYLVALFVAVGLLMILAYLFASYVIDFINDDINRRHFIVHEVVICIGIGILVAQLALMCKTYNSFASLYARTSPVSVPPADSRAPLRQEDERKEGEGA